jgi:hypothetical protein
MGTLDSQPAVSANMNTDQNRLGNEARQMSALDDVSFMKNERISATLAAAMPMLRMVLNAPSACSRSHGGCKPDRFTQDVQQRQRRNLQPSASAGDAHRMK